MQFSFIQSQNTLSSLKCDTMYYRKATFKTIITEMMALKNDKTNAALQKNFPLLITLTWQLTNGKLPKDKNNWKNWSSMTLKIFQKTLFRLLKYDIAAVVSSSPASQKSDQIFVCKANYMAFRNRKFTWNWDCPLAEWLYGLFIEIFVD